MEYTVRELEKWNKIIEQKATELGLDYYPQEFEIIGFNEMIGYEAYVGMPSRYPHWSYGKAYEKNKTLYSFNLTGLPYEMVINSDPCLGYLMRENTLLLQILTMAHVYGHNDFFKNNRLFREGTKAYYTIEMFKLDADIIRDYINDPNIGYAKVEKILSAEKAPESLKAAAQAYLDTVNDGEKNTAASDALVAELEKVADGCENCASILKEKEYLSKKSVWIFGGDGWAYDIGFGGVDHVLASGEDVNIMVFDTEVYSNTGGQASKASQIGQVAQFAAAGKSIAKKSLAEIAMSYGYVYVAQIAMGANMNQTIKALTEAEAYHGPSIVIAYAPCEMHSIKGGMVNCQNEMKKAVECGYWNMFRYNPALKAEGKNPFTIDSKPGVREDYQKFLLNEARYSALTRSFPERAKELFAEAEQKSVERYNHLKRLEALYAPDAE